MRYSPQHKGPMAILPTTLDYSDKDFDALRVRLYNLISSVYPKWTESQIANFGNLMLESFAFVGDVLLKYQDNQAGESRLVTTTQRKNAISHIKMLGYVAAGASASAVDVTFSLREAAANDVVLPIDTVVRTTRVGEITRFRTLTETVIPAGTVELPGVTVENSEARENRFTSTGAANFEAVLTSVPFLDDSAVVTAGNGVFERVDNFLDSNSFDLHYTVIVDQNDQATIRFGNGINGAIPTASVVISYRTGGGAAGVVDAETITVVEGFFTDVLGNPVILSVLNPTESSTAVNRETLAQIQVNAPQSITTSDRSVGRTDFEINAGKVPGVSRALFLTSNQDTTIQENRGALFILPNGGGVASTALKEEVKTFIDENYPPTTTFQYVVLDTVFRTIDIVATVHLVDGATPATAKAQILAALTAYFKVEDDDGTPNTNIDYGLRFVETTGDPEGKLPHGLIRNEIQDTPLVYKIDDIGGVTLNGSKRDVDLLIREFPRLGNVTVINAATGTAI